jgi:xanthine phosphoribosyltransferase
MKILKERILRDGIIKEENVLKVDSFLNHQMDMELIDQIAGEFQRRFADKQITKVLTIEASGIAIGCAVARLLGVPLVSAKKSRSINIDGEAYVAEVESYDTKKRNLVVISKKFLSSDDHVLIVDDFLANGFALQGLISLVEAAEATVEGLGIVIEKGFQEGGHRMRNLGYHLESLAVIESMDIHTGAITFRE